MSDHPIPVCWAIEREAELRALAWERELGRRAGTAFARGMRKLAAYMAGFGVALREFEENE